MAFSAAFVLDNSVTMAWCFPDEQSSYSDLVLQSLKNCGAVVPGLWSLEVANILLVGERRNRILRDDSEKFINLLAGLPIFTDDQTSLHALMSSLDLGRKLGLSSYDACYLELALRTRLPVATLDEKLKIACQTIGAGIYQPSLP